MSQCVLWRWIVSQWIVGKLDFVGDPLCYVMLCYIMLMLCYVTLCYVMLCTRILCIENILNLNLNIFVIRGSFDK